jgi:hypothetical protein
MNNKSWEPGADEWLRQYDGPKIVDALVAAFNQASAEKGWRGRTPRAIRLRRNQVGKPWKQHHCSVLCVETGEVYANAEEAASLLHVCPATIRVAIYRGNKSQGFHWKYVDEETPSADMPPDD